MTGQREQDRSGNEPRGRGNRRIGDRPEDARRGQTTVAAMLCAAALIAHQVGSKAARDTLYLANFPTDTLPWMAIGAASFSILLALLASRAMSTRAPSGLVPRALLASAALMLAEWSVYAQAPRLAAIIVYLHVASLGSILVSSFWLIVNECFDPRAARREIGRITAAATLGGLLGGALAWRSAAHPSISMILTSLAALHLLAGVALMRVRPLPSRLPSAAPAADPLPLLEARSAQRSLSSAPYLRTLGLLVFVTALGAALVDYVLKARARARFESDSRLLLFFGIFYTAVSLGSFLVQALIGRFASQQGLTARMSAHPLAIGLGSSGALLVPGVVAAAVARGAQTVLYNSLFRSSYEALFTPIAPRDKRAAKGLIDVGCERAGDAAGFGLVLLALLLPAPSDMRAMLLAAGLTAVVGLITAGRLQAGYEDELRKRLISGGIPIQPEDIDDPLARTMMLRTLSPLSPGLVDTAAPQAATEDRASHAAAPAQGSLGPQGSLGEEAPTDPGTQRIAALRSADPQRVLAALASGPIDAEAAAHVVRLLAWDAIYPHAARALAAAREGIEPVLVERLGDPQEEFAIRRRIPWILGGSSSRLVIDALLQGLLDPRFEVRFRCGRALARIHARDPSLPIDRTRVFTIVLRETRVDRHVWESQRLLDQLDDTEEDPSSPSSCATAPTAASSTSSPCCRSPWTRSRCRSLSRACTPTIRCCAAPPSSTWRALSPRTSATPSGPSSRPAATSTPRPATATRSWTRS